MVAERIRNIEESTTVKSASVAAQLKKSGVNVISFGMGEPDFDTPENIREAAKKAMDSGFTHYTPAEGIPELREAIAEKSKKENLLECGPENVVVMPSKFAIFASMFTLLEMGDGAILPDPGWQSYGASVALCGASSYYYAGIKDIPAAIETCRSSGKKPKLLVLNSPSNPTGKVFDEREVKELADIAESENMHVLSDEVYEKLVYDGRNISIGRYLGDKAITINGLSKTYAMTGWRVGWCVAYGEVLDGIRKIMQHTLTCSTSFAQYGALEALRGPQESVELMRREFEKRRNFACAKLKEIRNIELEVPKGAFYLFPSYLLDESSEDLCNMMLKEAHVILTPGTAFGKNGEKHFRLSYAASMKNLEEGLNRIEEFIERYKCEKF